jgi:2-oxo-4-hydroxy-4-carboxy-5-ureidoimidazoline decarboxylase
MTQALPTNATLENWNRTDQETAMQTILPCNGSRAWATLVAYNRPFATPEALFSVSDRVWRSLPEDDWQQAFDSHPRIGEKHAQAATSQSLQWSAKEQSAATATADTTTALADGNRAYEARFGRIFIIRATGKTAPQILGELQRRLNNDPATELHEAAEQQRQITQLRLHKWLGLEPQTAQPATS